MKTWILSIICTVLISAIITMLLPEGKLLKHIKIIFGFIIIFVVIQPVFSLRNEEINFNFETNQSEIVFQKDYLSYVSNKRIEFLEESCEEILKENGFKNSKVHIEYTMDEQGQANVVNATIDLKNSVFIYETKHIDIIEDIITPVSKYLNLEEKQVDVIE